jgi:hypothetical protein
MDLSDLVNQSHALGPKDPHHYIAGKHCSKFILYNVNDSSRLACSCIKNYRPATIIQIRREERLAICQPVSICNNFRHKLSILV